MTKEQRPAVEGWFTLDADEPHLLGTRCTTCGDYFFPREATFCRNPRCDGRELEEVELSRRGRVWSFTNNCYPPPEPFMAPDPFEPYVIAAVELEKEKMVVLGQMVDGIGIDDLTYGQEVELTLDTLFENDEAAYLVWKWKTASEHGE